MPGSKNKKYRYMVLSKETLAANSLLVHMGVYASTIRLDVFLGPVILTRTRVPFFLSRMKADAAEGWLSVGQGCIPLV